MRKHYPTDLSDAEWNYIQPHLPTPTGHGRPRIHDLREILGRRLLRSEERLPVAPASPRLPYRWPTLYHYFRLWRIDGTWEKINRAIRENTLGFA
jgi:putative transposase